MKKLSIILGIVFIVFSFTILLESSKIVNKKEITVDTITIKHENVDFFLSEVNVYSLKECLEYYNIEYSDIIIKQAILETGNFKSKNCKENNNLFGLYNSKKNEYFKFNHWTDCVKAYYDLIQYRHKDGEDYYSFLRRIGYAEDPEYINKLKTIKID